MFHALNVPTPETATSRHFLYAYPRKFDADSDVMDEVYRRDFFKVFMGDMEIMEAQQRVIDLDPGRPFVDINVDAPGNAVRRMLHESIEAVRAEVV